VDSAVWIALSGLSIWLTYLVRWLGCSDNLSGWLKLPSDYLFQPQPLAICALQLLLAHLPETHRAELP